MKKIVLIEFQRVQTFLFAVPRLADIVGANALLGETVRYELPALAINYGPEAFLTKAGTINGAINGDPIEQAALPHAEADIEDNPDTQWQKGIISRDGGHFRACFVKPEKAEEFAQAAYVLLLEKLPGLRCEIRRVSLQDLEKNEPSSAVEETTGRALFSLPMLQQCEEVGNGPASYLQSYKSTNDNKEIRAIGLPAKQRKGYWQKFKNGKTNDIAALMSRVLTLPSKAETFEQLCGDDYLALIHADGNGLGEASKQAAVNTKGIQREAAFENFYHAMRVTLRLALKQAIENLYGDDSPYSDPNRQGVQILMLGGDDLLIACRAPLALPLVKYLAQAMIDVQKKSAQPEQPSFELTLGVGVAIAKPSFPFHRLHDLAETLASSAKRLVRNLSDPVSVVDWEICSEAWYGDLKEVRQTAHLLQYNVNGKKETLALSAKPYKVLDSDDAHTWSLEKILERQKPIAGCRDNARSQLRGLVRMMRKGRRQADSALLDLCIASPQTYELLKNAEFGNSLWLSLPESEQRWFSTFADLVEVMEIPRLKTEKTNQGSETMIGTEIST